MRTLSAQRNLHGAGIGRRTMLKSLAAAPLLLSAPAITGCAQRGSTTQPGTLNIGQISRSAAFFPLFIADQKGYFKAEGINLGDRPELGTGAKVAAALKSGSIDLGAGVITDAFNLAEVDPGARLVSSLVTEYYVDIVVGPGFQGPPDDAPVEEKIAALAGKNIGITGPGSGTEALVKYLFGKIGKDAATGATLVNLGSANTAALGALKSNQVQALSFFQPIGQQAETTGVGKIFISPARGDILTMRGALHGVVFSTQQLLDRKADVLPGFQRAMAKAEQDIHGDPAEVRSLLTAYLQDTPPAAVEALLPILGKEVPGQPTIDRAAYETALRFHVDSGLVKKAPKYEDIVPAAQRQS
jgi:NitT/TauT family transport system substrate-binding protein